MPPGTILQLLVGIVALALLWTTWYFKQSDNKKKVVDDKDKIIDSLDGADDIMRGSK